MATNSTIQEIAAIRAALKQKVIDKRGPWCERCLLVHGRRKLGGDLHEFIIKRGVVSRALQVDYGVFCEENCGLLCRECHDNGHNDELTRAFIRIQISRGYDLNPVTGYWPAWLSRGKEK